MRPVLERVGGYLPAAVALALPVVYVPGAFDSFILPRVAVVIGAACVGTGLAVLVGGGRGLGPLRLPLVAACAAAGLAFVTSTNWALSFAGSYTRYESLPVRLAYIALLATPVWLSRTRRSREVVGIALVIGTSIASLEAIYQLFAQASFRPDGNLGNPNLLGALIAMAVPLAVAKGLRGGRYSPLSWAAIVVMAGGLYATTSRSGGWGMLAGCGGLLVFSFRRRLSIAISAAGVSAVLIGALWAIVFGPLGQLNNDPARSRLQLWPDALRMIVARPLTGWGEDATGLVFGHFIRSNWAPGVMYDRTHSGPLEIAATQGILGLLALGLVLALLLRGVWRYRFSNSVAPLGAACIGYTAWVVFNFDWAPATGAFWLLAGTAWAAVRAAEPEATERVAAGATAELRPSGTGALWRSALAVGLALAAVALATLPLLADVWYYGGRADLAVKVDPLQARYHWSLGDGLIADGSLAQGVDELRRAADLGETDPTLYVDLGDQEKQLGRTAQALSDYRRALEIDPYYAPALQRLAH